MIAAARRRARSPHIPGDKSDRTGSRGILRRAIAEIRRRFEALQAEVLAIFDAIPTYALNDIAAPRVLYGLTPEQLAAVSLALQQALERWIANGRDPANVLWWAPFDAEAAQLGTAQSVANLTALAPAYAATRTLQSVIWSEPYRNRVAMAQVRSMEHWTGLAAEARATLAQIIGRAVVDGKNPKAVRTEIAEALGVSRSRAALYAQTDVTGTLREARWAEAEAAEQELGLQLALLWTSALIPTTRPTHAARHGKAYTPAEVRAFYASGGERYRCHCSQTECLLGADGKPILSDALRASMAKEKAAWKPAA